MNLTFSKKPHILLIPLFLISLLFLSQNLDLLGFEFFGQEVHFVKSTTEMAETSQLLVAQEQGKPHFQHPILPYWFILFSYKIFGVNWFAARFVSVFFASLTICLTWLFSKELINDNRLAFLSTLIVMTWRLFFRFARSATLPMCTNFFIILALYYALKFIKDPSQKKYSLLFFVSCGVGFMVGGIIAIYVPIVTSIVFLLLTKKTSILKSFNFPLGLSVIGIIIAPWLLYTIFAHSNAYLTYIFSHSDFNLVNEFHGWPVMIIRNVFFSIQRFVAYTFPWLPFFLWAIPLAMIMIKRNDSRKEAFIFLLSNLFVILISFSFLIQLTQPYILLFTVPYGVLIGFFLLEHFSFSPVWNTLILIFRKYLFIFIIGIGFFALSFILVFLAGANKLIALILLVGFLMAAFYIIKTKNLLAPPVIFTIFLVLIFSQSYLLTKIDFTPHTVMYKFSEIIKKDLNDQTRIGTCSHSIHRESLQIFFDREITKAGRDYDDGTRFYVSDLLYRDNPVYCVMTENDYENYFREKYSDKAIILAESNIIKKQLYLNPQFFLGLLRLDEKRVRSFLLEKIVLFKKSANVRIRLERPNPM